MAVAPRHAQLHTTKILHLDYFLASIKPVPRHCTSVHLPASCNRDSFLATYQTCTATLVMLNKICTWTAKTRAIPFLHRDSFLAKEPGLCPVRRQVTQPPFIAGPLGASLEKETALMSQRNFPN